MKNRVEVKPGANDNVKANAALINSELIWHDTDDKKDPDGNVWDWKIYEENTNIALEVLKSEGVITKKQAQDIINHLSDKK